MMPFIGQFAIYPKGLTVRDGGASRSPAVASLVGGGKQRTRPLRRRCLGRAGCGEIDGSRYRQVPFRQSSSQRPVYFASDHNSARSGIKATLLL